MGQLKETSGEAVSAFSSHGALSLTIEYHALRGGAGQLTLEILDPEDHVLGRAEHRVATTRGSGNWQQKVVPEKPLQIEDMVWDRVRYSFRYSKQDHPAFTQIASISQILRQPVVHILGQKSYLSGSNAAIRAIVTDADNKVIAGGGSLRIQLLITGEEPRLLFSGNLNRRGTTEAQFQLPGNLSGNYQLHYVADTPIGSAESTLPVRIEEKASILLTTEKPIYQPGQTIHLRALALDRANHKSVADRKLTFVIEDSRGNKVFKHITKTDAFGIASGEFALADEVNLGTYHLSALLGNSETSSASKAELALNVERYVLPKFKVAIEFAGKDKGPKTSYRPGDHVTGTVHANYFFGKPVDNAQIEIEATSMDVSIYHVASAKGTTDKDGSFHFDLTLPDYFAGRPLSQGAARVLIEATVKDSAEHSETHGEPITVSQSSLLITAIPEGGKLIPHLENQVYILTSYPDGRPATTHLKVHVSDGEDQQVVTDKGGVAVVRVNAGKGNRSLAIEADDERGSYANSTVNLESREGDDHILLRTNRTVYRAGDRIELNVFSTEEKGSAYVDIVKDGQTILTRDVDIESGHAELVLTATPEMAGTLDFNAYLFGRDAQPIADHRLVFVQPAEDLKIEAAADAAVYKPGAEARIHFHVTNAHGDGVRAALGLQVVDEAVFALAEKQPGFAKVFFYLEQEVMKPRYEINSISMNAVVEPLRPLDAEQQNRAAGALFAATEMTNDNKMETEFGRGFPHEKQQDYAKRYREAFEEQVNRLTTKININYPNYPPSADLVKDFPKFAGRNGQMPVDAWGTELQVKAIGGGNDEIRYYEIRSAGPDRKFDTADDLTLTLAVRSQNTLQSPVSNSGSSLHIEHNRGAFNGRAEITGTVVDQTGAVIPSARVTVHTVPGGIISTTRTNDVGQFTLSSLIPGKYEVVVTAQGFEQFVQVVTLAERDIAIFSATLLIGQESTTVAVSQAPPIVISAGAAGGAGLGFGQGRGGGVMGGITGPLVSAPKRQFALKSRENTTVFDDVDALAMHIDANAATLSTMMDTADAAPRIRSYFPEALYINPEILTDGNGDASILIPMADSITTWRMAMLASTQTGALGTGTSSLKVFQDFFVDLDMPVTLTQGDRVSIPVAVYNYSGEHGDVSLKLEPELWYSLVNDSADKSIAVDPNRVGSSQFTLEAKHIGKFKLTLSAKMKGAAERADIVVREIEVIPNGREQSIVYNGRLDSTIEHKISFPAASIPDASKIFVRLYPGPLSQVIEGMDSLLRMPYGCFEQTSSSTYPNVLALDYMKRTNKLTPEVHAKAEGYIANGYQRLLTFEVPSGGFSWFGNAPANKILTSYGLMEFSDMSKVYDVDPKLIVRTQQWLASQQQPDGSWKPDTQFIYEGATNRYNSDVLRITAYIAWALRNTDYRGYAVERAMKYIESHLDAKTDLYTLAVVANFSVEYRKDADSTRHTMQLLLDARTEKDEQAWWSATDTGVYATGQSAAIETTGLAVQALLKWGQAAEVSRKAINYIAAKKQASGTWGTTQATIMALRALLLASEIGSSDVRGSVHLKLNGKVVENLPLTPENNDLFHQFVLKDIGPKEQNSVQIQFEGTGGLAYQVVGSYFLPWDAKPLQEPMSIDVAYDRTKLAQNDIATVTATIKNNLTKTANMVMVDLGIPPGFDLLSEDLQSYVEKSAELKSGRLEKFSQTATQAILYFDSFAPQDTVTLHFRLRAKYPIRARTFQSRVYEYYDPEVNAIARPVVMEIENR
jgi:uncharacterized protein YfaS (alpha-2-macroglobulin family)